MLLTILILAIVFIVLEIWKDWTDGFIAFISFTVLVIVVVSSFVSYCLHAKDLGVIRAQSNVIQAQTQMIDGLEQRLVRIVPTGQQRVQMLLNADSPVKALVEQIGKAQEELSKATVKLADAKVDIEARKAGPYWFVVSMAGDK